MSTKNLKQLLREKNMSSKAYLIWESNYQNDRFNYLDFNLSITYMYTRKLCPNLDYIEKFS